VSTDDTVGLDERLKSVAQALVRRFPAEMGICTVADYARYAAGEQSCPFCFLSTGARRPLLRPMMPTACLALECGTCHLFVQISGGKVRWGFF
jgi:hypothetical protein